MKNLTSLLLFSLLLLPFGADCQYFTQAWEATNNTSAEGFKSAVGGVTTSVSLETEVDHSFSIKDIFEKGGENRNALYFKALNGFKKGEEANITISFDQPVNDLCFELYDVDRKEDHQDMVAIQATNQDKEIALSITDFGESISKLNDNAFAGLAPSTYSERKGDLMVCFDKPVDKVTISYADFINNGTYQVFGIGKFNWLMPNDVVLEDFNTEENKTTITADSKSVNL